MERFILYTTHCPKCLILEKKLQAKGVDYVACTDVEEMKQLDIQFTPVLKVEDSLLNFSDAVAYVNKLGD